MPQTSTKPQVCEDCLNEAYNFGFQTLELQEQVMIAYGDAMYNHLCSLLSDDPANPTCACACNPELKQPQSSNNRERQTNDATL